MPTPLDPQLISTLRKANTIVFHQLAAQDEADVVVFGRSEEITTFKCESAGAWFAGELAQQLRELRIVSQLHAFDSGLTATIRDLLRQGDSLRVYNTVGAHSSKVLTDAGLVDVHQYLVLKRRATTDQARGGKEYKFLIAAGAVSPARALAEGCIAL